MNDITIRKARETEVSKVLYFIEALAKYERMRKYVKATEEDILNNVFKEKRAEVIFLCRDDEPIGFAVYYYAFSTFLARPTLFLEDFYVEKDERANGFGHKVLSWLAKEALDNNCQRFEWNCLEWNKPSMRFYEALGAKPLRGWVPYRLDDKELQRLAEEAKEA
ncbi:MAG: GNAT family N-acetyltransferase [Candidatus Izimaplasma sp.]|nr:GNAT family N-acetyltransferase [Candidatus Izimaplasma bacterium]